MKRFLTFAILAALLFGSSNCFLFEKKKDNKNNLALLAILAAGSGSSSNAGSVIYQDVNVTAGVPFTAIYNANSARYLEGSSFALATGTENQTKIEVSVQDDKGIEKNYRRNPDGSIVVSFTPEKTGTHRIAFKNNSEKNVSFKASGASGGTLVGDAKDSNDTAKFKNIALKAYVGFSRQCKTLSSSVTASNGDFFVQPLVFLGKVDGEKKVTDITTAVITLSFGGKTLTLSRLADLPVSAYDNPNNPSNSIPSSDKTNKLKFVKTFYQGYFAAAGEFYTLNTFSKSTGADCSTSNTFSLGESDPGSQVVTMKIVDAANGLDETFTIKPSVSASFSIYTKADTKLTSWTQCTYNKVTGEYSTYNVQGENVCKEFSLSDPPYLKLDSQVASQTSAPTRILYYGYSNPKDYYTQLIKNAPDIAGDKNPTLTLTGCLNNGGINGVSMSTTDKMYIPLREFNSQGADVIQLSSRPGSFTSLKDFYQGNVNVSGSINVPSCVPQNGQECPVYKTVKIDIKKCNYKADSSISVGALNDSFIYPDSFSFSGVITE
ncbi:MAG: hypothetical protein K8R21_05995 [Leptospira sp.]|nr:hypothetical protein [Leptospira sp.]